MNDLLVSCNLEESIWNWWKVKKSSKIGRWVLDSVSETCKAFYSRYQALLCLW